MSDPAPSPAPPLCIHCDLPVPPSRRRADAASRFCCFGCRLARELSRPAAEEGGTDPRGTLLIRLGMGIFLAMNIMVFNGLFYSREWYGPVVESGAGYGALAGLFAYLQMFLASAVIALVGVPLAADALSGASGRRGLFRARIDTNLLIGIGVLSAYALSVVNTVRGRGSLYYDTAAMVLVLVTLGNYLEAGARRRAATSAGALLATLPARVRVRRDDDTVEVDAATVTPGDLVAVRPGEAFPVDGRLSEGSTHVDESVLTGESRPRAVDPGDVALAGSVNLDGPVWIEATRVGPELTIRRMQSMLDEARLQQPPIQRIADRVARVFVPGVVTLAAGTLAVTSWRGDPVDGLFAALSVLLISCPCALGLAAPLATWTALRRAAERGILIDSGVTLERAARVRRLFFDKTGTLTERRPRLSGIETYGRLDESRCLAVAAALETASLHPIARAVDAEARRRELAVPRVESPRVLAGLGVEANVDGRTMRLGGDRLVDRHGLERPAGDDDDASIVVHLMDETEVLASLRFAEAVRPEAEEAVGWLRELGVDAALLTGDGAGPARRVGDRLGLPVESGLLPEGKLEHLRHARSHGSPVAMVGDGINDAPVLAAADVGIAMGSATDLARRAGNVRLAADRLGRVPRTLAIARDGMRKVRFNLAWAFAYNAAGLTLAATGRLTPIFAASAMFVSSLVVVAVSRTAGRIRERPGGSAADGAAVASTPAAAGTPSR